MSERQHDDEQHGTARDDWTEQQTGDGGSLGAPAMGDDDFPGSGDVETQDAISGGGVAERDDIGAESGHEAGSSEDITDLE